jgi:hypothetical protein
VIRLTKLHGSIDWHCMGRDIVRVPLPFGAETSHPQLPAKPGNCLMIYPNAAKDRETADYPYVELFRDYAAALCQPGSVLVTYGYGFGDEHINRAIEDMLTIPSTHLLVIAYGDPDNRIRGFLRGLGRPAQVSILFGSHFGHLQTLVDHYLPKPALDLVTPRLVELKEQRKVLQDQAPPAGAEGQDE